MEMLDTRILYPVYSMKGKKSRIIKFMVYIKTTIYYTHFKTNEDGMSKVHFKGPKDAIFSVKTDNP